MRDSWEKLGDIVERVTGHLAPVTFNNVEIDGPVAVALYAHAMKTGAKPEVVIAEAVRAYMGDAA